ncbi:MAG: Heavy metal transport/detoxification protein [Parcubacteria group bacterium GW2011_GWA2_38_13]|nr:MAG: Heavy metal transport/detoxification protein [Parcubacteria group bacterium GW2011_GWA2_38_13]
MKKITIPIRGMHCKSCEILIEGNLKKISGVHNVDANYKTGKADIFYNSLPPKESVQEAIKNAGYDIGAKENLGWISKDMDDYYNLFTGAIILTVLYVLARQFGLFTIGVNTQSPGLMVALVVGLVAGISTCMALVGGLVLGLSARHAELHPEISAMEKFRPHLYFNLGRIVGFGILGGIIGYLGSMFKLSIGTLGIMTIMVGGVMIFLGLKLMEIFPRLKNTTIALPKNISKFFGLHKEQKEYSHTNSFITGALTFFLPCGFTQAMQLYAVSSGSFIQGAAIMSLFALGTAPGLLGIGGLASVFKGKQAKIFFSAAGMAVILFGSFNIANGSQLAFQKQVAVNNVQAEIDGIQEIRMTQGDRGYSPNTFTVQKGKKIRWIITSTNPYNCASSLVVPKYGISKYLEKGENIIEFVPTPKPGSRKGSGLRRIRRRLRGLRRRSAKKY